MLTTVSAAPSAFTRRRFLEELGFVGGTSLVMCAMASWELIAGQAGRRPVLSGRPSRTRVLVLGAGVSGLVIAYELGRLGYDYHVLEARDRVGGLAWTVRRGTEHTEIGGERQVCSFDTGLYVNVGAWRIPYTHTGVLNYCRELGVPVEIFVNEAENAYFYYEGPEVGPLAGRRVRLREVKADMIGYTNELLVKALDQGQLDLPVTVEDRQRFLSYLVAQGYLDSSDRRYKAFAIRGPGNPYDFAALLRSGFSQRMRSVPATSGTTAAPMFQPVGGMDQFPKGFERAIGGNHITFNADVQSVHQSDTAVSVVYIDTRNGRHRELRADFVVVCMPLSVLSGIDINLSTELMASVKATTYSNSAKMGLAMKRRFWEEDDQIFGGITRTNLDITQIVYPSAGYLTRKGIVIGYYLNGQTAARIGELTPVERQRLALEQGAQIHPQYPAAFENAFSIAWQKVAYSKGGWAQFTEAQRRNEYLTLLKPDRQLYLAGDYTTYLSGWMAGALESARTAVRAIHDRSQRSSTLARAAQG
jgi:monoamine oxidase